MSTLSTSTTPLNVLNGTANSETITGTSGMDLIDGGAGNDLLQGKGGSDTYKFGRASGNDTIAESYDTTVHTDAVLLDADVKPGDVVLARDGTGDSLILRINGSTSVLTVKDFFEYDGGANPYGLEEIRFADGTVWSKATVMNMVIQPTAGNDTIVGYFSDDVLDGAAGNDWFDGRGGSDVYKFGRASGNDTIAESYDAKVNTDAVLLDADVKPGDVVLKRDGTGDSLILRINGSTSVLTIKDFFEYDGGANPYGLEEIRFADGTVWSKATVMNMVIQPTAGSDTIVGYFTNDVLDGGAGNDWLDGRGGSDTYKFGIHSGNDTIAESYDYNPNTDVVQLCSCTLPSNVVLQRDGTTDTLLLRIKSSNNVLTILNFFDNDGVASPRNVEEIRFANGTLWDRETVKQMVIQPTTGNDTIVGYFSNDVLDGGAGNDWFDGRGGSDTYKFGIGSGNDTIAESSDYKANTDTVLLGAGISQASMKLSRPAGTDSLVLSIVGTTDTLTIKKYFTSDGASAAALEQIKFADGSVWTYAMVKAMLAQGGVATSGTATMGASASLMLAFGMDSDLAAGVDMAPADAGMHGGEAASLVGVPAMEMLF